MHESLPEMVFSALLQDSSMLYSSIPGRQIKIPVHVIIMHIGSGPRFNHGDDGICITPAAGNMQGRVQIITSAIEIRAIIYLCLESYFGSGF